MSSGYGVKLKAMRKAEGFTQAAMSKQTGIAVSTIKNYETQGVDIGLSVIERVLATSVFQKYTLWLMTDKTAPESGQISPVLAHCGQDETTSSHSGRKTG